MSALVLSLLVAALPVRTAETVPEGVDALHLTGGFLITRVGGPPAPIPTGEAEWAHGATDGIDVRLRYAVHLGVIHRFGGELRSRILEGRDWAVAWSVFPSFEIAGALQDGLDYGGDVSSQALVMGSWRAGWGALTLHVGVSVEWVLFENIGGVSFVDDEPRLDSVDFGLELEHPLDDETNLTIRLEASAPTAPDDPFTVFGLLPRILVGSSFSI